MRIYCIFPCYHCSFFVLLSRMRWYDRRLVLKDLNEDTDLNRLSDDDKLNIWSPGKRYLKVTHGVFKST